MTSQFYNQEADLFVGQHLRLYRDGHGRDDSTSLLKTPVNDAVESPASAQLNHEYKLCRDLDVDGILRPKAKETVQGRLTVVFEDPGGITLMQLFDAGPVDLSLFFNVAIELVGIVGRLHRIGIVHKDIHAGNILVCTQSDPVSVYLTGLGIASLLPGQSVAKRVPDQLEGTLEVMSPEQTGRMNRPLDYRTDYYSLGVVFYQMLTAKLPFAGDDPLALVHAHLAIEPQAPSAIDAHIPHVLSDLVLKLLAKDADDRYRSAAGIAADLKRCRDRWSSKNTIAPFRLGLQDVSENFHIPDKLYGRDAQMRSLEAAFERTCNGPVELVLVTGYAGIGKTELVNQIRKSVFQKEGYFIAGKCDPLDRKIPCAPFIEAISDSIDQLLARPQERIDKAREILAQTLGNQGRVLTDLVPVLSLIIGDQPPVPDLPPDQARNRLHLMLQRLFSVITIRGVTMVVFLDDLQWADFSTLKMLHTLACDTDLRNVLLIGAYRDQEIDETHSLPGIIEEINDTGGHIQTIALGAMQEEGVQALISDALNVPLDSVRDLAILCCRKTGGNPFFLKRFLLELVKRKLIFFDATSKLWQWHADKIDQADVTDNVIELMTRTIVGLDESVQQILKTAACIGSRFDLGTLSHVNAMPPEKLLKDLWPAVQSSLISLHQAPGLQAAIANDGQSVSPIIPTGVDGREVRFAFIHDRVHEAAYGLMDPDQRMQMHLRIGRLMLEANGAERLDEKIFDILGQLNRAIPLITAPDEIVHLTELNLKAGQKARDMALLESAFDYFRTGIELMGAKGWQQQYEWTRALYLGGIESAFVTGRHSELDQWFEAADEYISSPLEAVDAFAVKIEKETANWNFEGALDHALTLLGRLSVHLPMHPATAVLLDEMEKVEKQLCALTDEELLNLPAMENPNHLAVFNILFSTSHAAFFVNRELYILSILKGIGLLLRHGNNDLSPVFFSVYSSILTLFPQTVANAPRYGRLSIRLLERLESPTIAINTKYYFICGALTLVQPVEKSAEAMKDLYKASMEAGTMLLGGNCLFLHELVGFCMGKRLDDLNGQMSESRGLLKRMHHDSGVLLMDLHQQMVQNLMGRSEHAPSLMGPAFDERIHLPVAQQTHNETFLMAIYFCKMMLAYFFENHTEAGELADKVVDSIYAPPMPWYMARCYLYAALARTAGCQAKAEPPEEALLGKVAANQQWLQSYTNQVSVNYRHMLHLVKAERARVEGRYFPAVEHYDQAIDLAGENGYLQDQALANELAAKFWMGRGKKPIARIYMHQALDLYTRWGATAKVRHLKENHSEFFIETGGTVALPKHSHQRPAVDLDMVSALRASRAISGEIVLEGLIEKLMAVVVENAGATSGRLLLETDGALFVVGEADAKQPGKVLLPGKAVVAEQASHLVPMQIIQYVDRTGKPMVIEDVATHEPFARDPYIMENHPRSVLCSPIVRKEKVIGLFYLENHLTAGAFTAERLKMLEILSAQIAVSLENARLYEAQRKAEQELKQHRDHLEELVKKRTEQLAVAKEQAEAASQSKSAFLANMSHEIRTPMNAVIGFTDIMMKTEITEQQEGYLQAVKQGGANLMHLIDDILDFSKIEAGKMDLDAVDFNPELGVFEVCNLISTRISDKPVELLVRADDNLPAVVRGDPGKYKQVLINLLGNAAKFTESGEIEISLKVVRRQKDGITLQATVRDTGIGIAPEQLENIFSAFEQADGTVTRRFGGTGLGLTISKKLAAMMGGDLWVESTPGQGSRFHFTVRMKPGEGAPRAREIAICSLKDKKVLIVDDNANNLTILEHYLKLLDMKVTAINNAGEVLPLLLKAAEENDPFDICLLDIHMPQLSGYEVAQRIRCSGEPLKTMPLLALSSLAKGDAKRGERAGFNGFIAKPVMRPQLYRMVQRLLGIGPAPEHTTAAQDTVEAKPQRSTRILLVEDSAINMMLAENILTSEGFRVQTAENGYLALNAYTQNPDAFDLILMDVQMPVMDGLTATEKIRQWETGAATEGQGRRVPIVAMTAGALKGDREKCLQAGMDDYIAKPVIIDEVLEIVFKLTSKISSDLAERD